MTSSTSPESKLISNNSQARLSQVIADDFFSREELRSFFLECGVPSKVLGKKHKFLWHDILFVFQTLLRSTRGEKFLFRILERACHPDRFANYNIFAAQRVEKELDKVLKYDGYSFVNHKITRIPTLTEQNSKNITFIFFDQDGHIWREPKECFSHTFSRDKRPFKIIKFLAYCQGSFSKTPDIAKYFGVKKATLRTELGQTNRLISSILGLEPPLIESQKNSGYRINPIYKLIEPKNH